jgi:hypothetical protein
MEDVKVTLDAEHTKYKWAVNKKSTG